MLAFGIRGSEGYGMTVSSQRDAWVVFYRRAFGLATAALLGYLLYRILSPFFGPLVWALFLAFLLQGRSCDWHTAFAAARRSRRSC
jgi:uncharacterized protein YaaW (UPF0174 family)